jgi:hypothetical protein
MITYTWLQTSYIDGNVYGLFINKDILPGKLFLGLNYRFTDYNMYDGEISVNQHVAEASINWRILKKLSFSISNESTFEKERNYNRLMVNLTQRF